MFKNLRIFISLMPIIALLLALAPETAPVLAQETIVFQAQSSQPVLISTDCPEGVEGVFLISRLPEPRTLWDLLRGP
jgi:hypothetical protein